MQPPTIQSLNRAQAGTGNSAVQGPSRGGPAFEALLEKLDSHAAELHRKGAAVQNTDHLANAVDSARDTLVDALTLGDQLLEAYREALQQGSLTDGRKVA